MDKPFRVYDWYNRQFILDKTDSLEPWKSKILKICKRHRIVEKKDFTDF